MSSKRSRALIVIDPQNEYVTGAVKIEYPPLDVSLPNIARAIEAAAAADIPVVLVQHAEPAGAPVFVKDTEGWQFHPSIQALSGSVAKTIHKALPSAFAGTDLEAWLRARGINTITIAGYLTNNCDQSTANNAVHLGFDVEFLSDASGAISLANEAGRKTAKEVHDTFGVVLQSRFAAVLKTQDWIRAIGGGAEPARSNLLVSYIAAAAG